MNVRDMINNLISEYKAALSSIVDGKATIDQQQEIIEILTAINFYTNRLLLAGNDEIEGT